MDSIRVSLPAGKTVDVRPGTKIEEIAAAQGFRKTAIAAKLDGRTVDLARVIEQDASLEFISPDSPEGLDVLRHSTAHLMAQAVAGLFFWSQVTIGLALSVSF